MEETDQLHQALMTKFCAEIARRSPMIAADADPARILNNTEKFAFEAAVHAFVVWLSVASVAHSVREAS